MALDSEGNQVGFGDWLVVVMSGETATIGRTEIQPPKGVIIRIVKLSETPKGTSAIGAYVDLVGHGRIAKCKVDVSKATLVMRADGTVVS